MQEQQSKLAELLDHERWQLNNGLVSDTTKNNLFLYGSIVNKKVEGVELAIEVERKLIKYDLYVPKTVLKLMEKYKKLSESKTIFGMWRFRSLLKKHGNLDFNTLINKFVKDYCGNAWSAEVRVLDYDQYTDGYGDKVIRKDIGISFGKSS